MDRDFKQEEKNNGVLRLSFTAEEFSKALDEAFKRNAGNFEIQGFRKGKAPKQIVLAHYGEGILYDDAISYLVNPAYIEAIEELDINPVSQPELNVEKIGSKEGLEVVLSFDTEPEAKLGEYKGVKAVRPKDTVNEEDIENEIKRVQERNARLVPVEDEAAKEGDTVNIDFEGFKDGVAFDGGKGEGHDLELGSNSFIPGFEDQLVGAKAGDDVKVNVTFPEEYHAEDLAGADAVFEVKVNSIKRKELPKLDDAEIELSNSVGNDANFGPQRYIANRADHMHYVTTDKTKSILEELDGNLNKTELVNKEGSVCSFANLNGTNYVVGFYDMKLAEIYKVNSSTELEQITFFNDELYEDFPAQSPEHLEFKSSTDNSILDGFVITPPEFVPENKASYPAILAIHGGPKTAYGVIYNHEMQVWADAGYVVFYCNPHGSSGKGDVFSDIRGKYGEIDYQDILDFTEAVLEKYPAIDKNRLGVTGGSYGGFMTNWIITHTDMFKAAATQRSIYNWLSFYGTSDIGYYFATDQNKTTIDDADFIETLWNHSPMKFIDNAKTPTLIIHSDEDYRCPVEQAYQLHVALVDRDVDSKLVLFHGENHELSRSGKPQAREERLEQITSWMDKYLKNQDVSSDEMDACTIGFC